MVTSFSLVVERCFGFFLAVFGQVIPLVLHVLALATDKLESGVKVLVDQPSRPILFGLSVVVLIALLGQVGHLVLVLDRPHQIGRHGKKI